MMDNDETVGVGSKVKEESFTGQFAGQKAQELEYAQVDAVSNATYSSKAAVAAINLAIQAYQQVRGD
jgi:electron transport complex protein RnfG